MMMDDHAAVPDIPHAILAQPIRGFSSPTFIEMGKSSKKDAAEKALRNRRSTPVKKDKKKKRSGASSSAFHLNNQCSR